MSYKLIILYLTSVILYTQNTYSPMPLILFFALFLFDL